MRRLLLAAAVCLSSIALADLTLVNEAVAGGKTRTVTLSVKGTKALFEMKEADGPSRTMLRDAEAKKLFIIDHEKKAVLVVTEQDSKQFEERQELMRAQLKAQLDKMTPEQRARAESTMLAPSTPAKAPVYSYEKKKTPARKVSGFSCQDYLIKRDGQPGGEGCFASWKDVGIAADEFKSIMLKAMPSLPGGPIAQGFEASDGAPGFPVFRQHLGADGAVMAETTLKSLSKGALKAESFELPKDYAQKSVTESIPGSRQPRRQP